jgi:hypothetical protein
MLQSPIRSKCPESVDQMHAARLHALQGVDFVHAVCMRFFCEMALIRANFCEIAVDPSSPVNT